jgi:hypothetical protein
MVEDPKARQQPRVASVFIDGRTDRTFLKNSWLEIVFLPLVGFSLHVL